jgi:hypothetical protein
MATKQFLSRASKRIQSSNFTMSSISHSLSVVPADWVGFLIYLPFFVRVNPCLFLAEFAGLKIEAIDICLVEDKRRSQSYFIILHFDLA